MLLTLILDELFVLLVDAVVSQMDVLVILADLVAVGLSREPSQSFFVNVNS